MTADLSPLRSLCGAGARRASAASAPELLEISTLPEAYEGPNGLDCSWAQESEETSSRTAGGRGKVYGQAGGGTREPTKQILWNNLAQA